jgi:hypothetical protein
MSEQHLTGAEVQTPGNQTSHTPAQLAAAAAEAGQRPALFSAKWPYPEVTPDGLALLYRAARAMISIHGYNAYDERHYAGEQGISIGHALEMAATGYIQAIAVNQATPDITPEDQARMIHRDAMDLREDLETRLAAVLYVLGQQHYRTGIQDLADRVASWELGHDDIHRHVDAPMALALLEQAAGMYDAIAATDGADPVTTAPAVPPSYDGSGVPNGMLRKA